MWMEENLGERINVRRADEALATGASLVATACPYCAVMLDDAVKSRAKEGTVEVLDLAVLLERANGTRAATRQGVASGRDESP